MVILRDPDFVKLIPIHLHSYPMHLFRLLQEFLIYSKRQYDLVKNLVPNQFVLFKKLRFYLLASLYPKNPRQLDLSFDDFGC